MTDKQAATFGAALLGAGVYYGLFAYAWREQNKWLAGGLGALVGAAGDRGAGNKAPVQALLLGGAAVAIITTFPPPRPLYEGQYEAQYDLGRLG